MVLERGAATEALVPRVEACKGRVLDLQVVATVGGNAHRNISEAEGLCANVFMRGEFRIDDGEIGCKLLAAALDQHHVALFQALCAQGSRITAADSAKA